MVLLKVFLVLCFVAYATSLKGQSEVDSKSPDGSAVMARDSGTLSSGGSAYLELYIYYDKHIKKRFDTKQKVIEYLKQFLKKVNKILKTAEPTLTVQFSLLGASQWNEDRRALTEDRKALDAQLLIAILEVYGKRLATRLHKKQKLNIDAVLFLTTSHIRNVSVSETENTNRNDIGTSKGYDVLTGVVGRIGGICLKEHFVAAATDGGKFQGVKGAARQLSFLMGAVEDGQGPPGWEYVQGSDGASWCPYNEGYLMGKPDGENSERLSECSANSFIMGIRQHGPGCYDSTPRSGFLDNVIVE
ncbi:venom metalloproteinase antarease-like TpachMP_A [Ixodes scapularis]|uniref:venom metalloproteinase antarease-like TpachMP_A n=1 Tax=Ixodes scapularis TaxID=6945 RepID=UPI001A9DC5B6|nr:venom metalloproteinase antarease-like TpachMP_A [Ixodes scapularis]